MKQVRSPALQPFKSASLGYLQTTIRRSALMARVRRDATAPELVVREMVKICGVRFTVGNADLSGRPDLANRRRHFAIFVHGCFWHRHPGCRKTTTPVSNHEFWQSKFDANVARDRRVVRELRRGGLRVLTIWECETEHPPRLRARLNRFFALAQSIVDPVVSTKKT